MNASINCNPSTESLHAKFLTIAPRVELHAKIYFRGEKCPHTKADRIAETVATAWKWFVHLAAKGKDASAFPMALASLAARAVKCGRKVAGQLKSKDALNEITQQRCGFAVEPLPISTRMCHEHLFGDVNGQRHLDAYEERLADNSRTSPSEQAMFRIDFGDWLQTLTARERKILQAMSLGHRTQDLSRRFQLSEGRISQMRGQFRDGWRCFVGDDTIVQRRRVGRKRIRA